MAELNKWVPSDMLDPIKRFLDGDLTMTPSIKVEQFVDGTTLVVRAEVPGIDPDKDVDVSVSEGMLHIRAEREEKTEHKSKDGYRSEFRYGSFSRSVALPPGAKEEDITATYKDGVLEVRAPAPVTAPDDDGQEDQDRPPVATRRGRAGGPFRSARLFCRRLRRCARQPGPQPAAARASCSQPATSASSSSSLCSSRWCIHTPGDGFTISLNLAESMRRGSAIDSTAGTPESM